MHYSRALRGRPLEPLPRIVGNLDARFWAKVEGGSYLECWRWTASLNDGGYGQFAIAGRPHRAHRVAYQLLIGAIPEGLVIDYLCRNRWCINPWHLDPVTDEVNRTRGDAGLTTGRYQRSKTQCPSSHPYDELNTRIDPQGHRRCRACERAQSLSAYYRRRKALRLRLAAS